MDSFMLLRWGLASLHLLGFGLGLGAVWMRAGALQAIEKDSHEPNPDHAQNLDRAFFADNLWGLAALLWVGTGLYRAFGGVEKGTAYYLNNTLFWIKMALFIAVIVLEMRPMITLIRWRRAKGSGQAIDPAPAGSFARTSRIQALIVILIVFIAVAMARGMGAGGW